MDQVGDVLALEVAAIRDVIDAAEDLAELSTQHRLDLRRLPDEVFALVPFAVGVLRCVEAAVRMDHLAADVGQRLLDDLLEAGLAAEPPAVEVQPDELRIVVKHLLEMRHQPLPVRRVAVEAAAEVVIDPAGSHLPQRVERHVEAFLILRAGELAQQHVEGRGRGELGRVAEPAVDRLIERAEVLDGAVEEFFGERLVGRLRGADVSQAGPHLVDVLLDLLVLLLVGLGHAQEHLGKSRHAVPRRRGKVGPSPERLLIGRQKDGQRPAAAPPHEGLRGLLVNVVEVGAFLPVHFDVDEVLVHDLGDVRVLEGLPLHHVAPVASRVADREQNRLVLSLGAGQGLLAPGVPVHRVVGVLPEIGARLVDEAVRVLRSVLRVAHNAIVHVW